MVMDVDAVEETGAKQEPAEAEEKLPLRRRILREIMAWGWVLAAFLFIHGTLVQARVIPSGSMEETLLVGDHLLVSRFGYDAGVPFTGWHVPLWKAPQRGQMIVFRAPFPGGTDYVKRVIGLPGDRVEIRRGVTWINGKPLSEPYRYGPPSPHETYGPETVTPGNYFVMGDNRANSYDSRYWGFVPRENIIGTPVVIYMSVEAPEEAWQPGQLRERFLAYVNAAAHPRLVRWKRLFVTF
jgi:signal peptidase I